MGAEGEAAGDVLTGAVIGGTVEHATNAAGKQTDGATEGTCLNCGAQVTGAYCSACGQRLHLHRTLTSIGHDILHGVFHFEGKLWRTLPELFLRPGQLTRRYIDGERAKFISPMALYLFTVFVMFAVISFTPMSSTTRRRKYSRPRRNVRAPRSLLRPRSLSVERASEIGGTWLSSEDRFNLPRP